MVIETAEAFSESIGKWEDADLPETRREYELRNQTIQKYWSNLIHDDV